MRWKWIDLLLEPDFDSPSKFGASHKIYKLTIKNKYGEVTVPYHVPCHWVLHSKKDHIDALCTIFDEALMMSPTYGTCPDVSNHIKEQLNNVRSSMHSIGFTDDFMAHVINYHRGRS